MTPKQIAWIKLISLAISTGAAIGGGAYAGGAKLGYCIVIGAGAAASAVYHSLSASPNDAPQP